MNRIGRAIIILLVILLTAAPLLANDSVDFYYDGIEAFADGRVFEAIEMYRNALSLNPDYFDPLIGLAQAYFSLEEYEEALVYVLKAKRYEPSHLDVLNLEGRIRIGLEDFSIAGDFFRQVLEKEPNNQTALFGLAELDIVFGSNLSAAERFSTALRMAPESRRGLLSLVLLYESMGNYLKAEEYLKSALRYHGTDPQVRYFAARHYLKKQDLESAEYHGNAALSLKNDYLDANLLLSDIYLAQGRYEDVIHLLGGILTGHRDSPILWYTLGTAYERMEAFHEALQSFTRATILQKDDEIARIALENLVIRDAEMDDPVRQLYSAWRFERGDLFETHNYTQKALREYRRGLIIDPHSREGRIKFARIYKHQGAVSKYVSILEVLESDGEEDWDILDDIEIGRSLLSNRISTREGFDQFSLERWKYAIGMYFIPSENALLHYLGEEAISTYVQNLLHGKEHLSFPDGPAKVSSYADAFRLARRQESDFFILLDYHETERSFSAKCSMYLSETGSLLEEFQVFRTGNDRVSDALSLLVNRITESLPLRANLIKRRFSQGIIDLGTLDGISEGDIFLILPERALELSKTEIGYNFSDEDILAEFTVTETDELVSEGTIKKRHFFDLVNIGDSLIIKPEEGEPEPEKSDLFLPRSIYREFLRIP